MARSTEEMLLDAFEFHADHGLELARSGAPTPDGASTPRPAPPSRWRRSVWVPAAAFLGVAAVVTAVVVTTASPRDEHAVATDPTGQDTRTSATPATTTAAATSAATSAARTTLIMVPSLIGMTEDQARDALLKVDLTMQVTTVASDDFSRGRVVTQSPAEGQELDRGAVVTVGIGSGVPQSTVPSSVVGTFVMPNITQLSPEDAAKELAKAGWNGDLKTLTAGKKTAETSQPTQVGLIVDQNPATGTNVPRTGKITITVGVLREMDVPNLAGMTYDQALGALQSLGWRGELQVAESNLAPRSAADAGTIASQKPAAGARITVLDNVAVSIYAG